MSTLTVQPLCHNLHTYTYAYEFDVDLFRAADRTRTSLSVLVSRRGDLPIGVQYQRWTTHATAKTVHFQEQGHTHRSIIRPTGLCTPSKATIRALANTQFRSTKHGIPAFHSIRTDCFRWVPRRQTEREREKQWWTMISSESHMPRAGRH